MKILYISVHATLEYQEIKLFTEIGHEVFSHGAYIKPEGHYQLPRPGIPDMKSHPELEKFAIEYPKTNMPQELIDWADIVITMHDPNVIVENWDKMKHKKVIWRTIGQSTKHVENMVRKMRYEGMKIVRMSPMEENIEGYLGSDGLIRFYGDPEEYSQWNGKTKRVINLTQSLLGRRVFCHYDQINSVINGFPSLVYGTGNDDLSSLNGGELTYDLMKGALRDNRCYVYGGTWPSPYTLAFIEPFMTGIPVIALGTKLAEEINIDRNDQWHYYEIGNIIKNGENGFISDSINELRNSVHQLLEDEQLANRISKEGRKTALRLFDKEKIKLQWKTFFETL